MKYVALIPARGGSKGIPRKNLRPFNGMPLIFWACKAAQDCPAIESAYVSTDDPEIRRTVEAFALAKIRPIERAPQTATDGASTESVMLDFAARVEFENIVLIQATSPLLTAADLARGVETFEATGCDSAVSVVPQHRFRWTREDARTARPLNYDPGARPRRQDWPGEWVENGAFYISSRAALLNSRRRLSGRISCVEMPEDTYLELDSPEDWEALETLHARRRRLTSPDIDHALRRIRLVATDVDGCLTDGGMYYNERSADEWKKFNARDGHGFELLRKAGLLTAIITGENTEIVARRAAKLQVTETRQGIVDKVAAMAEILSSHGLEWDQAAYLGDDAGDYALLARVGLAAAPADATAEARRLAHVVLSAKGGAGAFRELADLTLRAGIPDSNPTGSGPAQPA